MKLPDGITEYEPLAGRTTIGTGGAARFFASVGSEGDLMQAALFAREQKLPLCVLGRGSNVLIDDGPIQAVVAVLAGRFRSLAFNDDSATVAAGAGVPLIKLGTALARRGHAGCAFLGVIPGSVGGAVRMNAGIGPGQEISSHLIRARVFDPRLLEERWLEPRDLRFRYRGSGLAGSALIVLEAAFRLPAEQAQEPGSALGQIKELFSRRRATQPHGRRTFGSTFKNPAGAGHSAGWYLEQAGMKGVCCGGAAVASEHANWIVNTGGAVTGDVRSLIETGRTRVFEKFGIALEREVVYLPGDYHSTA